MKRVLALLVAISLFFNLTLPVIFTSIAYPLEIFELPNSVSRLKDYKSVSLVIDKLVYSVGQEGMPKTERNSFILNKEADETIWISDDKYKYWIKKDNKYNVISGSTKDNKNETEETLGTNPIQLDAWGFLSTANDYDKESRLSNFKTHDINLGSRMVVCLLFAKIYKSKDSTYVATYYIDSTKFIPVGYVLKEDNSKTKKSTIWRYEFNYMKEKVDMSKQLKIIKEG